MLATKIFHQPLAWVKPELEKTIKKARSILEPLADQLNNEQLINELNQEFYLLKGSLEILGFNGAALLLEDMQKASIALKNNSVKNPEETYEALLEATLSLESFIDKLQKDQADIPVTLLPVINDIRAAIDEPLLSESALFLPNLSIVPKTPSNDNDNENKESQLQECAKSLRPYYQAALLSWFRNPTDKLSIQQMKLVARNLESTCYSPRNRQIWWILGGLFEALADKGLKSTIAIRLLLGQSDRIIKALANNELSYYEKSPPFNLLKNTLYYISRASSEGERVSTLKKVYQLDKVMPSEKDLSELRKQLKGPNSETMQAISKELKKILAQAKANLENFSRNSPDNTDRLLQTIIPLKHVADTLSILSMTKEKQLLQEQIIRISKIIESKKRPSKDTMMDIAAAIIEIDTGLHHIGLPFKKTQEKSSQSLEEDSKMSNEKIRTPGKLPETEYRYLASRVLLEAKDNVAQIKNAILSYITAGQEDNAALLTIPELLSQINGCLQILNNTYAANVISKLKECINDDLIAKKPGEITLDFDLLAESLVSFDYYLEALSEERYGAEQILNMARDSLEKLGYIVQAPKRELKIPTLEAVVTHISEAPTRIRVNASSLSEFEKSNIAQKQVDSSSTEIEDTTESVVEFSPESPDDEVAEIFIEEALEELDNMESQLKNLRIDLTDKDTLSHIHRIYHTLKGSGKIAGAIHVSDFSSTLEEYLNRALYGAIQIDNSGVELLFNSHSLLHELIECFSNRVAPPKEFNILTEAALSLMSSHKGKSSHPEAEAKPAREQKTKPVELSKQTKPDDKVSSPAIPVSEIEALLKNSFLQLATMNRYINENNNQQFASPIPQLIVESITQLHKCAQLTSVKEFIQTTELLTKYIGNLARKNTPVNSETLDILSEFCSTTREILFELPEILNAPSLDVDQLSRVTEHLPEQQKKREDYEESSIEDDDYSDDEIEIINALELSPEPTPIRPEPIKYSSEKMQLEEISESYQAPSTDNREFESDDDDLDLIDIFIEEAEELISRGNKLLEDKSHAEQDENFLAAVQRLLHTMKGSARMAGASSVANIAHAFESLAEAVSTRQIAFPDNFLKLFQQSLDAINDMIDDIKSGNDIRLHEDFLDNLEALLRGQTQQIKTEEKIEELETFVSSEDEVEEDTVILTAEPSPEITIDENTQQKIASELTEENLFGEAEIADNVLHKESIEFAPSENLPVVLEQIAENALPIIVESALPAIVEEKMPALIPEPESAHQEDTENKPKQDHTARKAEPLKINSELIDQIIDLANSEGAINNRLEDHVATIKTNLLELDKAIARALNQLRDLQFHTSRSPQFSTLTSRESELNLSQFSESQKIALRMMESIGDIENLHSVITKTTLETDNLIHQQKKSHSQIYENLLNTRLVSFSNQTQRMQRIVRQTCQALNKKAQLNLEGTEGFIDRVLLESLMGPIEHILRNAIAHGIENTEKRQQNAKPETGQITIRFNKQDSENVIEIQDDGAGINPQIIRQKAIEKGLIKGGRNISDSEAIQLIFEAGFSTADTIDQISGRGVGMNVVLTEIEALGGSVAIHSVVGQGTTFTIRLPFTVSRNKTLLIKAGNSIFALPVNSVLQTIPVSQAKLEALYKDESPVYEFEEQDYPLWHIDSLLNKDSITLPNKYQNAYLLVLKHKHKRLALQVDSIMETRESVLKPASAQLANIKGLAGTTILDDGKIVLILDIPSIFSLAEDRSNTPGKILYRKEEVRDTDIITALIVDDSITVRKVSERFLNRNGITTKSARDGLEALETLKSYKPDVILLDIEMPNMDGLELARRLKSDEPLGNIPIIMITSRTGQQHRQTASEIGIDVFLGKPYQESELLGYIQALTGKRIKNA